jgi:hypothetical protein
VLRAATCSGVVSVVASVVGGTGVFATCTTLTAFLAGAFTAAFFTGASFATFRVEAFAAFTRAFFARAFATSRAGVSAFTGVAFFQATFFTAVFFATEGTTFATAAPFAAHLFFVASEMALRPQEIRPGALIESYLPDM